MRRKAAESGSLEDLRRRAELRLPPSSVPVRGTPTAGDRLVHELEVHQAELELQNEELQSTSLELERSRDRYLDIYDLAPVGHVNLDLGGAIVEANHAAVALLGIDRQHLIGRKLSSFMSATDGDIFHIHRREALGQSAAANCQIDLCAVGGKASAVHLKTKAIRDLGGKAEGLLCVLVDLSDLRQAEQNFHAEEQRARESEARLRELAQHVEDALMLRDRDGTFLYVSPAYGRIWARPVEELLRNATVWIDSVHPDDRERLVRAEAELETGSPFEERYRIRRPDGRIRWVRSRFFPFRADFGERLRYVGIVQDITAERSLKEELQHARTMEAIGSLASAVAHDFGNLLQGIMGCADVALASERVPGTRQAYLEHIVDAVRRGSLLVRQLADLSRKTLPDATPTPVDDVLARIAGLIERLVGKSIRLQVRMGAPRGVVLAEPVQIERILMNLAANARDAMPEGGTLTVDTEEVSLTADVEIGGQTRPTTGRYVRLTVSDTGRGMDEATRSRLFEPFFTTKPPGLGTGIGLSSVLAIAQAAGGRVDVESTLGRGASFVLHFPCIERDPAGPPPPTAQRRLRGRVLLVEDDSIVRVTIRHYLEELGIEVLEASGAEQAFDVCDLSAAPIDVCVTDVTIPGENGPHLVKRLEKRYPLLRSLFVSAHSRSDLLERGIITEKAITLHKPFDKRTLAETLETLLPV